MRRSIDLDVPGRALAIGAHPDDIEFGCGATLAKWAALGADVQLCVLTDGSKGTWDPDADLSALVARREEEQRDAAAALGAKDVHFLRYVDGELDSGLDARREVCRVIREVRPDVVLGHDPWRTYRLHPDHRHAGQLTIDGIVAARDPHFFADLALPIHRPSTLLLFEAERVTHVERVHGHVDHKVAALLAHRTQWRSTMGIGDTDDERERFAAQLHARTQADGIRVGARAAEAFARIDDL